MIRLKILRLPFQIIGYRLFRAIGWPKLLPFSTTLSITNKCNSKCKTCNIWKQKPKKELSTKEWRKILKSLGDVPIWFTITGGEPFLRNDLVKIIDYICKYNKPLFVNIATNALVPEEIIKKSKRMIETIKKSHIKLTINVSLDEIGRRYDLLRGTEGGFRRVLKTIRLLKQLKQKNNCLNLGINITVSQHNVGRFYTIYNYVTKKIKPDSIISEMATNRKAFFLGKEKISPKRERYVKILDFLINQNITKNNKTVKLIQYFRKRYYQLIKENILKGKKLLCYAAIASIQISCVGNVINCCTQAKLFGNLRDNEYNFKKIWNSKKADKIRKKIKKGECFCTLANAGYTNLICNFKVPHKK